MTPSRRPGPNPPSRSGLDGSTMTLAASNRQFSPKPWQASQAPYGLLKENERGSICGTLAPHSVQASFWEKSRSEPLTTATITSPSASSPAVAIEASAAILIPGLPGDGRPALRSCDSCGGPARSLVERAKTPSMRARTKSRRAQLFEFLLVFTFTSAHDRSQNHDAIARA